MNSLQQNMLRAISLFEGSSGGRINVWDEQLLSFGTFHYAVGQGPGIRFLQRVCELDAAGFMACLGGDFLAAVRGGPATILDFCRRMVWRSGNRWSAGFAALSRLPAYQQADVELAAPYLKGARALAMRYGLHSERGLFWCLDRCVQQGPTPRPYVDRVFRSLPKGLKEEEVMAALAGAYAATANPLYRATVYRRSLTAAYGGTRYVKGGRVLTTGYPGAVNFERDYGISLSRPWAKKADLPRVFYRVGKKNVLWDGKPMKGLYGGERITAEWVARWAALYGPGASAVIGNSPGVKLTVYPDGNFQLDKRR